MSTLTDMVRAGLEAIGATGLICTEIPCGCGLNDLMPCDEPRPDCQAAYAVICDGEMCSCCEARPYPNRPDFETVCYVATSMMEAGEQR
mgnify:CR=1 FL=1